MIKETLLNQYIEFPNRPQKSPSDTAVDGPLLGNGDMGTVLSSDGKDHEYTLCKNDFWRLENQHQKSCPLPVGKLSITIYGYTDADYKVVQNLCSATSTTFISNKKGVIKLKSYVSATTNHLVVELESESFVYCRASLYIFSGRGSEVKTGQDAGVFWGSRSFTKGVDIKTSAAIALELLGDKELEYDGSFVISPDIPATLVLSMASNFSHESPLEAVNCSVKKIYNVREKHESWWASFWNQSSININDRVIEKQYYLSLYCMASCSRNSEFPPNIFGWVTTDNPLWCGDYHLNYNHQAPFYGLVKANRIEQADPHDAPLLDFMERAAWHCYKIFDHEGIVYPVGIGPKGIETTYNSHTRFDWEEARIENNGLFFNQRSNGSYALVNMASRWYGTLDENYGNKIYFYVLQLSKFWENYLTWDETKKRYIIENDSSHEGSPIDERNSWLSLSLCRLTFTFIVDLTEKLREDNSKLNVWENIIKNLSLGSTFIKNDKTVFRLTDNGMDWCDDNTLSIQHIYPGGLFDLDSDPKMLNIALNTVEVMQRWQDFNGSNSFFPAAVRVGYDSKVILEQLRIYCEDTYANGFRKDNPHGIENLSTVPNTINEMLCMGHSDVIRVFPVWPKDKDASFTKLRCKGAFLVSSCLKDSHIQEISVYSEKGETCVILNPWNGSKVKINRNGKPSEYLDGEKISINTSIDENILIQPITYN